MENTVRNLRHSIREIYGSYTAETLCPKVGTPVRYQVAPWKTEPLAVFQSSSAASPNSTVVATVQLLGTRHRTYADRPSFTTLPLERELWTQTKRSSTMHCSRRRVHTLTWYILIAGQLCVII